MEGLIVLGLCLFGFGFTHYTLYKWGKDAMYGDFLDKGSDFWDTERRKFKKQEREKIIGELEYRLTDDGIVDEYYHGYIQSMLDNYK